MKLETIAIERLHRTISGTINFDSDLNLLVGINGSGKTSILNAIDWLLRFDYASLCCVAFDSLQLTFVENAERYVLRASQSSAQLTLELVGGPKEMGPITVDFVAHPANFVSTEFQSAATLYGNLAPEPHEVALWTFLQNLSKPAVISLDRALSAEVGNDFFAEMMNKQTKRGRKPPTAKPLDPIAKVKEVTFQHFARYRAQLAILNDELKARLVISAFRNPFRTRKKKKRSPLTPAEVHRLEHKIIDLVYPSIKSDKEREQISEYFGRAKIFLSSIPRNRVEPDDIQWEVFTSHFEHLVELAEAFDHFDRVAAKEFETIGRYLSLVNRFLEDSGKRLVFDEESSTIKFLSFNTVPEEALKDISLLSSGERQIIVLLTFLCFVTKEDSVFIIDEPELSLHPKWQLQFLDAFLELRPKGTQILLATHSPEIVSDHKQKCIVLGAHIGENVQ